jgi:hypothetical protein
MWRGPYSIEPDEENIRDHASYEPLAHPAGLVAASRLPPLARSKAGGNPMASGPLRPLSSTDL